MPLILLLAPVALLAAPVPTIGAEERASPATGGARSAEHRIAPRAQALVADLPPAPTPPLAEGPPLSLTEALTRARAAAPDLGILRERVVQASLDVGRAWAQVKPRLDLTASYTRTQDPVPAPPTFLRGSADSVLGALVLEVPLFNGRAFPAIATANQLVDVARLTETEQRIDLLLLVAATYYSGVQLRELYRVAFRLSGTTRDHAIEAQARFEAGQIQRSAAVRARIDVLRADEEARRAVNAYRSTKSQLAQLLDRRDTAFELATPPDPPEEVRGAFPDLIRRALRDRPEMAAAKVNEEIAARLHTDAVLQFFPTVSANAAYRYNNVEDFSGRTLTWAVTLALTLPLYDGGLRYVALKDADSKEREARLSTRSQVARIEDELRRGQLDLESARALREEAEHALVYARENEELVRAQFEAGTATQVEVSDAQAALFQSEATALEETLAVQLAALRVARAVGAFERQARSTKGSQEDP
ncbi:MAG TPA: TolC family protein [Myxococcales bacterium]|nr:TolC family protein [Myxococcales bacterium]